MHLKKIEINGFKSFANKVSIDLSEGITCFVGPNGCGKSNIVDAVKWGIGEQRISTLRGDSMQDVIFKGNGSRPPMNFAEVSLFFSNTCGTLSIEYEEVVVTRRLYRTGESEYLLNRTPCRLKDIRALFYDTGIGVGAYSVMEQGRIDSILQADPVSRRAIFEEASGISRFKAQRREAERKLERTQANLLRLGDIVEELERRIRSLKNQAGRARSFLKHSDQLKALKHDHYRHQYRKFIEDAVVLEERRKTSEAEMKRLNEEHERQKTSARGMEQEIALMNDMVFAKKNQLTEAKTALEETQEKTGFLERRISELADEQREVDDRIERLENLLEEKRAGYEELKQRQELLEKEALQLAEEEAKLASSEEEAEAKCLEARQNMAGNESEVLTLTGKELSLKNKSVEAEAHFDAAKKAFYRLADRQNSLAADIAEVARNLNDLESKIEGESGEREKLKDALGTGEREARDVETSLESLDHEIKTVESELIKRESRIEVLESLIKRREGVGGGVKAVLDESARDGSDLAFIKGMLGELIEVEVSHSSALEAALGEATEAVVVDDPDQARQVIDYLERAECGRVTILPLSECRALDDHHPPADEGLKPFVRSGHPGLKEAVDSLLNDVHLIERIQLTSREILKSGDRAVTREGDTLNRHGLISLGGAAPDQGIISRRSELTALKQELDDYTRKREVLVKDRSEIVNRSESILQSNRDLFERIEAGNQRLANLNAQREKHLERFEHHRREYALNAQDTRELEKTSQELRVRLSGLSDELQSIQDRLSKIERDLEEARSVLDERRADRDRHAQARRSFEVQGIQFTERKEGFEKESELLKRGLDEANDQLVKLSEDRTRIDATRVDMRGELESMEKRSAELLDKRSESSLEITVVEERLEKLRTASNGIQAEIETIEAAVETVRTTIDELRIKENSNQVRCEGVLEKAMEELDLDLKETDSGNGKEVDPERDWDAVAQEIDSIKDRLSRMGNVNLEAINELEEVEARFESLTTQRDDLHKSIKGLEELIQTLNRESRDKFIETFERVRSHFNDIFRKLFQGGKADVRLREGEDVLEAGIDITAGPPGKDVRSISLLSGGERTLTAVGLLFALFKSRPSPFCILDEVDAALDEINVERFCNLLGDFTESSQFLIVTHSKRTMSFSNFLYGITMQEDGISSHLALNLEAYEEPAF